MLVQRQVGFPFIQQNIARCLCSLEVGSQSADNHCIDTTTIEQILILLPEYFRAFSDYRMEGTLFLLDNFSTGG